MEAATGLIFLPVDSSDLIQFSSPLSHLGSITLHLPSELEYFACERLY